MTDSRIRKLERLWKATGDPQAKKALHEEHSRIKPGSSCPETPGVPCDAAGSSEHSIELEGQTFKPGDTMGDLSIVSILKCRKCRELQIYALPASFLFSFLPNPRPLHLGFE